MTATKTLRERQAEQVRAAIVDAVVTVLESGQENDLTVADAAAAAGVSLRTVYRYFPTREDLLAAAGRRAAERIGLRQDVVDVEDIVTSWWANSARIAENPHLARALLYTAAGRTARSEGRHERVKAIAAAFDEISSHLPPDRAEQIEAVIAYLCGSGAFIAISDESGLTLDQSRAAVRWALGTLIDAARSAAAAPHAARSKPRRGRSATPATDRRRST